MALGDGGLDRGDRHLVLAMKSRGQPDDKNFPHAR
jgi:hypothetical protein